MKVEVHFGPGAFCANDNDLDSLLLNVVRLIQVALPQLILNVTFPCEESALPCIIAQFKEENNNNNNSVFPLNRNESFNSNMLENKEVKFQVVLEAKTKLLGELLVLNRKQWKWIREILLQEFHHHQQQQQQQPVTLTGKENNNNNNNNSKNTEKEKEAITSMEVVFLQQNPTTKLLHIYRFDKFATSSSFHHNHHISNNNNNNNNSTDDRGLQTICVCDLQGNSLGNVHLDVHQPPLYYELEEALKTFFNKFCKLRMAYKLQERRELIPLETNEDIERFIQELQSLSNNNNIYIVVVPLPVDSNNNNNNNNNSSVISVTLAQKREETQQMVTTYVRLMKELRQHNSPRQTNNITLTEKNINPMKYKINNNNNNNNNRETIPYCKSVELIRVRYVLDPLEIHVNGSITETELQHLAEAIYELGLYKSENNNNNNNNNVSLLKPKFEFINKSSYVLRLHDCGILTDSQIIALENCLVKIITSFGCRQVQATSSTH